MTLKRAALAATLGTALFGRLILYPYGIVWDFTLPWEVSSMTCRDVGLEVRPSLGVFINEC